MFLQHLLRGAPVGVCPAQPRGALIGQVGKARAVQA